MKIQIVATAGLLSIGLAGCATTARAPASSNLSLQDLQSLTAAYNLVQFDLAECAELAGGGASTETLSISKKICADAAVYQSKLHEIALARNVAMPTQLPYDLQVRYIALNYHPSPNVNAQYLRDAIQSHEEALLIFRDESANGQDQAIKTFDEGAIPVVQDNLNALRAARAAE